MKNKIVKYNYIIKRALCLLTVFVLVLSAVPFARAAQTGEYIVTAEKTAMLSSPDANGTLVAYVSKGTVVTVTEVRYGYGRIFRNSIGAGGWVSLEDLKLNDDETADSEITGIRVVPPQKRYYIVGEEEFDDTGMEVWAEYRNGSSREISGYVFPFVPSLNTIGEQTIYVIYTEDSTGKTFQASFTVTVVPVPVSGILAEGTAKTEYIEGQTLSMDGLVVRVRYSDGRADKLFTWDEIKKNSDFTVTAAEGLLTGAPLTVGTHTVSIRYLYDAYTVAHTVEVRAKQPVRLSVYTKPHMESFFSDSRIIDWTGLTLFLSFDNGTTQILDHTECEVIFDEMTAVTGENEVRVTYGELETSFTVTMIEPELTGLSLGKAGQTVYALADSFNPDGIVVYGHFSSGVTRPVDGWEVFSFDTSALGETTVVLNIGTWIVSYPVYVTKYGYIPGDTDLDGQLTASDARTILRQSVRLENLSGTSLLAADRDESGKIDAADARLVLRASVRLDPVFPVK